jgi:hypothetical protein
MAETKRRARGEDSIFYDRSRDRWTGRSRSAGSQAGAGTGSSRQDQDRGQGQAAYHATELAAGVRTPCSYTVGQCLKD